jgi:hypothetical protein
MPAEIGFERPPGAQLQEMSARVSGNEGIPGGSFRLESGCIHKPLVGRNF